MVRQFKLQAINDNSRKTTGTMGMSLKTAGKLIMTISLLAACVILTIFICDYLHMKSKREAIRIYLTTNGVAGKNIGTISLVKRPRGYCFYAEIPPDDQVFSDYLAKTELSFENTVILKGENTTVALYDDNLDDLDGLSIRKQDGSPSLPGYCAITDASALSKDKGFQHNDLFLGIADAGGYGLDGSLYISGGGLFLCFAPNSLNFHLCRHCRFKIIKGTNDDADFTLLAIACERGDVCFLLGYVSGR